VRLYTTLSQHAHELEEHSGNVGGRAGEPIRTPVLLDGCGHRAAAAHNTACTGYDEAGLPLVFA
jgi:hypothetical protein